MIPPEEAARANFYALLARLFYAPPDTALLKAISAEKIEGQESGLSQAWSDLAQAASHADAEAVREEYETAFIGTGKAPVTLYTSAYTIRYSSEVPLAELRGELARLGLARRSDAGEPEDHIAALCDTMRHLIAEQKMGLEEQRRFFNRWIAPAAERLCTAIDTNASTCFYRGVGRLAKAFLTLEQAAFEML
jgi:TorA maturation chaperone TorD